MGIDAVALLRPKHPRTLRKHIDLDARQTAIRPLDDGAVLFSTFISYREIERDPDTARAWLSQFGDDLPDLHDDPRGVLFFPDTAEPRGRTYAAVVRELGKTALWVPARVLSEEEQTRRQDAMLGEVDRILKLSDAIQRGDLAPDAYAFKPLVLPSLDDVAKQVEKLFPRPSDARAQMKKKKRASPPRKRK